jgi:hypothetical protein
MAFPRLRGGADLNGTTVGTDGGRCEGDVQLRTLPGRERERTIEPACGIARSVCAYVGDAKTCAPRICNTHRLSEIAPENHIAEPQSGWGRGDLLRVCL